MILKSIDEEKVNSNPWSQSDFYDGTLSAPRALNAISDVGSDRVKKNTMKIILGELKSL